MQHGESKQIAVTETPSIANIDLPIDHLPAPILSVIGDYIENPEILQLGNQFFRPQKPMKSPFYQMTAKKYQDLTGDFQEWWDLIGAELTEMSLELKKTKKENATAVPKSGRELLEDLFNESNYKPLTFVHSFCIRVEQKISQLLAEPITPQLNAYLAVYCYFRPYAAGFIFQQRLLRGDEQQNIRNSTLFLKNHLPIPINKPEGTKFFTILVDLVRKDENLKEAFLKNRYLQPCLLENIAVAIEGEEKPFWDLFENLVSQEQLGLDTALARDSSSLLYAFQDNFKKKSHSEQCSFLCKAIDMVSTRFDWLLLFLKGHAALPNPPKKAKYLGVEQSAEEKHFNALLQIACSPIHPHPDLRSTLSRGTGNLNFLVLDALFHHCHFPKFFNECLRLANDSLGQAADSMALGLDDGIANLYVKFVIAVSQIIKINKILIPLNEPLARERFMHLMNASPEVRTALEKRKENQDLLIQYLPGYPENPPFIEMIILLLTLRTTLPDYDTQSCSQLIRAANDEPRVLKILLQREDGKRWLLTAGMEKDSEFDAEGTSLQHCAAYYGNLEVLIQLVEHLPIIDLNAQAGHFVTPLMSAVFGFVSLTSENDPRAENCFKVVNYLLDKGADLNAFIGDELSIFDFIAETLKKIPEVKAAVIKLCKLFLEKGALWNGITPDKNAHFEFPGPTQTPYGVSSKQDTEGFVFFMNHPMGHMLRSHLSVEECQAIFSKITRKEEKALVDSKQENTVASLQEAIERSDEQEFRRILNTPEGEIFALHASFEFKLKGLEGQRFPLLHGLIRLLELENRSFKLIVLLKNEFPKLFAVLLTSRMAGNKTPLYYLLERGVSLPPQGVLNVLNLLLSGDGKRMINVADTEVNLTPWELCVQLPCGAKCVQLFIDRGVRFVFPRNFYTLVMNASGTRVTFGPPGNKESKVTKQQLGDYCQVIFKHLKAIEPAKEFLVIAQVFLAISTSLSSYELTCLCLEDVSAQDYSSLLNESIFDASPLARAIRRTLEPYVLQVNNDLLQDQINSFKSICLLIAKGANLNEKAGPFSHSLKASDLWRDRFSSYYKDWKETHRKDYQTIHPQPIVPFLEAGLKAPELQPPAGYTWEKAVTDATDEVIFYHLARLQVHYDKLTDEQRVSFDKLCKERFSNYQAHTKQRVDSFAGADYPLPLVGRAGKEAKRSFAPASAHPRMDGLGF